MKIFTRKRIIWGVVVIVVAGVIGYGVFGRKQAALKLETQRVEKHNLKQTVLTTGQVVSAVDLSLSFPAGGIVRRVFVKEGDRVKAGQLLATLDQVSASAGLTSARGAVAQAVANRDKVLAGASSEAISVAQKAVDAAQVTLDNAQRSFDQTRSQQAVLVANARRALLNSSIEATSNSSNISGSSPTITGAYSGPEGQYKIRLYMSGDGIHYVVGGLGVADALINTAAPVALGTHGLYIQFPSTVNAADQWTVDIPNTRAATYLTNLNAYQSALQTQSAALTAVEATIRTAQTSLAQAKANLDQQRAAARPADISAANAQILSAQGQLIAAQAVYANTMVKAPVAGTITRVDVKVGEQTTAMKEVMILQDVGDLHVEANVSEANVASLKVGQSIDYTFDALGPDRHISGVVQQINPASTVVSGVVNYKITAKVDSTTDIKPGMTANMTILVAVKDQAVAVPSNAVLDQDGKKVVRVADDAKKGAYHSVDVQIGLQGDSGLVEIVSGLSPGQEIVTLIK